MSLRTASHIFCPSYTTRVSCGAPALTVYPPRNPDWMSLRMSSSAAAAAQRAREELIELTDAGSARAAQIATFKTEIEALQIELAAAEQRAAAGEAACADARAIAELMEEDTANTLQALSLT